MTSMLLKNYGVHVLSEIDWLQESRDFVLLISVYLYIELYLAHNRHL